MVSDAFEEFGPYLVYERLGQGGMATVHRAEKRGTGIRRPIALKRLLPYVAADPALVKLFVDEARLASHLHHANVAQTYELGKVGETFFIAMEYASGPTLAQIVRQCQKAAGEIPLTIAVSILSQVCEALDYAHNLCDEYGQALRIIHRDVSPANIIVTNAGIVKLIDFGIAKATISTVQTQTGFIKGKFGYIAPEYITGKIDARADLFAVGVVAHEMLSGRRLFEGKDDFETVANIRQLNPSPPSHWNPHVTADLDDIVMTALQRDPAHRWQSAGAMQVALANVARQFGLAVGSQQLAEWVAWAFSRKPGGDEQGAEAVADDTDAYGHRPPQPDSSLSIDLGRASSEVLDALDATTSLPTRPPESPEPEPEPEPDAEPEPFHMRAPTDSDETVPRERVVLTARDLALLASSPPRTSRADDATAIAPVPAYTPPRTSPARDVTAIPPVPAYALPPPESPPQPPVPQPPAPRTSRAHDATAIPPVPAYALPPQAPPPQVPQPQQPPVPRTSRAQDATAIPPAPPYAAPPQPPQPPQPRTSRAQDAVVAPPPARPSRPFMAAAPPTPPLRSARPALPFVGSSPTPPRASRTQDATPSPVPLPLRQAHASGGIAAGTPPISSSRELEVLPRTPLPTTPAAPPPAPQARELDDPLPKISEHEGGTLTGLPPPPPVPSSRELVALPGAAPAAGPAAAPAAAPEPSGPAESPPAPPKKQKIKSRGKATAKTRPQPTPAPAPAPAPAPPEPAAEVDTGATPRRRRNVVWLILLMVALGAAATAAAYFWPDLSIGW